MTASVLSDLEKRMKGGIEALHKEFTGLRTGRASTNLLDKVMVNAYGAMMPIAQVGTVSVPEPRTISVQVWDKSMVKAVEKGIMDAGLGLNPMSDGQVVRMTLPDLSEERRKELAKLAGKYAETARVAIRNVRRDGMEMLKKQEKDGEISEDEHKRASGEIQKLTDKYIETIDGQLVTKEKEILTI
jgi:ribosome recycling factor